MQHVQSDALTAATEKAEGKSASRKQLIGSKVVMAQSCGDVCSGSVGKHAWNGGAVEGWHRWEHSASTTAGARNSLKETTTKEWGRMEACLEWSGDGGVAQVGSQCLHHRGSQKLVRQASSRGKHVQRRRVHASWPCKHPAQQDAWCSDDIVLRVRR